MEASAKKITLIVIAASAAILLLVAIGWLWYFKSQFIVYNDKEYQFSIKYPSTWKLLIHPQANVAVEFFRPKDTAMDTLQENFNVTIQPVSEDDSTLAAFSNSIRTQMTAVFGQNIKIVTDSPVNWDWRQGHMMVFEAPQPNHLKMVNAWVLRGGNAYILTFLGDIDKYGQDALVVNEMIHSLKLE